MRRNHFSRALLLTGGIAVLGTTVGASALDARSPRKAVRSMPARSWSAPRSAVTAPAGEIVLSTGRGRIITLPSEPAFVWSSNPRAANIVVSPDSPRQIQLMAVGPGESNIFARNRAGQIIYSTSVRVGDNVNSLDQMLRLAMPDAKIVATTMNGLVLLTGTVGAPDDAEEAERLVKAFMGTNANVVSRLRSATPLQVNLQVKIAEVSRSLVKSIGSNLRTQDTTGGFQLNIAQGRNFGSLGSADISGLPKLDASSVYGLPAGTVSLPFDPKTGQFVVQGATTADFKNLALGAGKTGLGFLGKLFGVDIAAAIDLAESNGLVSILAEPNLTAMSGETASFLAGGEFPIPISQSLGTVSVEYKSFGVSLSFSPTVLADGRISMRVRPEVSQLSAEGSVTLNGFTIPAITTRRTETTVELGSGQSFMIGGLLQNNNFNSIDKAPGLGDVPILGALFRSNGYRRSQTELMIIVTPYLVKPVDANSIVLPTDGLKNPNDLQTFLLGQDMVGKSGGTRPKPSMAPPVTVPVRPSVGAVLTPVPLPTPRAATPAARRSGKAVATVAPGFSN